MVLGAYVVIGDLAVRQRLLDRLQVPKLLQGARPARPRRRRRRRSWARASASCGGTRRRPRSSWATPARWPSAACSPGSRSCRGPSCCCSSLGGLFVVITLSVILQVGFFKLTGRRVFLMAPLQHHFELKGWGEVTIVIRFWIIAGLCVGLGLGPLLRRVGRRR